MDAKDITIVGAGPAGLACAALAKKAGLSTNLLEKSEHVGSSWRNHYDRLHLHTAKKFSGLPEFPMPSNYPRYPSRQQVVDYLEAYQVHHRLDVETGTEVTSIDCSNSQWKVVTGGTVYHSKAVILATGAANNPNMATWNGLKGFKGQTLHSADYKNCNSIKGKSALVVGFGNSAGEIALDLAESGIETAISVHRPVRIIPRDLFGIPIQMFAIVEQFLPAKLADLINAPIMALVIGSYKRLGLEKSKKGAITMINEDGKIPLLDIGTVAAIRNGKISIYPGIKSFSENGAAFENGSNLEFDTLILATGYRPNLLSLIPHAAHTLDQTGFPTTSGEATQVKGLYFCGYKNVPTGVLREIGIEAKRIIGLIKSIG